MKKTFASIAFALLLAIALTGLAFAAPVAQVGVPFQGSLQATETDTVPAPYDILYVDGNGSGNVTHLGHYQVHFTSIVDTATLTGPDVATFVAADGDSLSALGAGQALTTDFVNFAIVEHYSITGGTGRFAGATGSFTVVRQLYAPTGVSTGSFDGTIVLAPGN